MVSQNYPIHCITTDSGYQCIIDGDSKREIEIEGWTYAIKIHISTLTNQPSSTQPQ